MLLQLLLLLLLLLLLVPSRFGSTKATAKPKACSLGGRSSCICLLRKVSGMCTNFTEWLETVQAAQEAVQLTEEPAFLSLLVLLLLLLLLLLLVVVVVVVVVVG